MAVIVFGVFFICAFFCGIWADVMLGKKTLVLRTALGGCLECVLAFAVCTLAGIFRTGSGTCLAMTAAAAVVLSCAGYFVRNRKSPDLHFEKLSFSRVDAALAIALAAVVLAECASVMYFRFEQTGAIKNVGIATKVYETGTICLSDPMMVFEGCICRAMGMHPLKFVHTVAPAVFITLYNICYVCICMLFKQRRRFTVFISVTLLALFGYQSEPLSGASMLLASFDIWAFLINAICPVAAVILMLRPPTQGPPGKSECDGFDETEEEWDMNRHRIINARNLAIAIAVLAVVLAGIALVLNNKINRLYDTTVVLEEDMDSRCSVYEFAPDSEGGGYLIKGTDGDLSFIGGGGAENADELFAFLNGHGTDISKWYVYSRSEEDCGALKALLSENRITVGRIYLMSREEIEDL